MIEQLASLLLPIDALLGHSDFNPDKNASSDIVSLFRNMWFLCILFGFTTRESSEATALDWVKPALARVAAKTPSMVDEGSHDAVASVIEYNSVIRQEYANTVSDKFPLKLVFLTKFPLNSIGYCKAPELVDEIHIVPGK